MGAVGRRTARPVAKRLAGPGMRTSPPATAGHPRAGLGPNTPSVHCHAPRTPTALAPPFRTATASAIGAEATTTAAHHSGCVSPRTAVRMSATGPTTRSSVRAEPSPTLGHRSHQSNLSARPGETSARVLGAHDIRHKSRRGRQRQTTPAHSPTWHVVAPPAEVCSRATVGHGSNRCAVAAGQPFMRL